MTIRKWGGAVGGPVQREQKAKLFAVKPAMRENGRGHGGSQNRKMGLHEGAAFKRGERCEKVKEKSKTLRKGSRAARATPVGAARMPTF